MRRCSLLIAGGLLWLFLAAVPALADGGPHVSLVNSGSSTLTADSCAGCHRAHTAQGEFLLAAQSEEALCLSCHGNAGTGATTNVEWGIQFEPSVTGTRTGVELGALRDGGFINARIDSSNPSRMAYIRGYEDAPYNLEYAISQRPKVGALGVSEPVNSAHIDLGAPTAGIADTGTVWGKGALDSGLGTPLVTLTCVECHNPHGNGNYRILRPVPGVEADPLGAPIPVDVKATYSIADTIVTDGQHGLTVNDVVTLSGVGGLADGDYFVVTITNGFTIKVGSVVGTALTTLTDTTLTGTLMRSEVQIADVSVDPDNDPLDGIENPTKNYTIIQTKGSQGVDSTYLLYARDVINARTPANLIGVDEDQPPVAITSSTATYFQTTSAHGLAVGDLVTVTGGPFGAFTPLGTPYTVASVASSSIVYDRFTLVGVTTGVTGAGTVVRKGIPGNYSATGGDYFRRLVPWNPAIVNLGCSNTVFSTTNSAYCGTANDAPNGRPSTITSGPTLLVGQQAFLDQMSTWCSQCHTRYYSASNENISNHDPISSIADRGIGRTTVTGQIYPVTYENSAGPPPVRTQFGGPSYGDKVTFSGMAAAGLNAGAWYVVETGGTSSTGTWFKVSATMAGAAYVTGFADAGSSPYTTNLGYAAGPPVVPGAMFTRVYQSSNSSWGYPREDATYKYQHSTASNRGCTVCHVAHGSNAEMNTANGTSFSLNVPYPDGTTVSTSSRLLKVDNRGTCQMCHDPTGTIGEGILLGGASTVP